MKNIIILLNEDKTLQITKSRPIYQKENRADNIIFLVNKDFYDNIENCNIMLQVLLPIKDEEHNTDATGKMRYMTLEQELYKGFYEMKLPITTTLTDNIGEVIMWFLFTDISNPEQPVLIKTSSTSIKIYKSQSSSSTEIDDSESYDVLSKMQSDISKLKETKLDKNFKYDEENSTIQFYSNGEPIGSPIKLDDEIAWKNWDSNE